MVKYEDILIEQIKRDKQITDNELGQTAKKFFNDKELPIVKEVLKHDSL